MVAKVIAQDWTYVRLGSEFQTSSSTPVAVTGMNFTPLANTSYELYGIFMLRTANVTVGARLGMSWPTGMTDGVVRMTGGPWAATAVRLIVSNPTTGAANALTADHPDLNSWFGNIDGLLVAGASPSGSFGITLTSESAGTTVSVMPESFMRYRKIQ